MYSGSKQKKINFFLCKNVKNANLFFYHLTKLKTKIKILFLKKAYLRGFMKSECFLKLKFE